MSKAWREDDDFDDEWEQLEQLQSAARDNGPEVDDLPHPWWRRAMEWVKGFWL